MNTECTSQAIRNIAEVLRRYADDFDRRADELDKDKDFEICGEVVNMVANMNSALRLDLLINRPVREFQKALFGANAK